jgi:hypothetical protein
MKLRQEYRPEAGIDSPNGFAAGSFLWSPAVIWISHGLSLAGDLTTVYDKLVISPLKVRPAVEG